MSEETLKDLFDKNAIPEHLYWTFSTDPRVQFMQNQGALGARIPIGVSAVAQRLEALKKKDRDDAALDELVIQVLEAHRRFLEASEAATQALHDLGDQLRASHDKLVLARETFSATTVTLAGDTAVYYDLETRAFVRQDDHGVWHALESDQDIEAAYAGAAALGSRVSTKQGKQALDEWERDLANGATFIGAQEARLAEIDRAVADGARTIEEGTAAKQGITSRSKAFARELEEIEAQARRSLAPSVVQTEAQHREKAPQQPSDTIATQKATGGLEAIFGAVTSDLAAPEPGSAADRDTGSPNHRDPSTPRVSR